MKITKEKNIRGKGILVKETRREGERGMDKRKGERRRKEKEGRYVERERKREKEGNRQCSVYSLPRDYWWYGRFELLKL